MGPDLQFLTVIEIETSIQYHLSKFGVDNKTGTPFTNQFCTKITPLQQNVLDSIEVVLSSTFESPVTIFKKFPCVVKRNAYNDFEMKLKFRVYDSTFLRTLYFDLSYEEFVRKKEVFVLPFKVNLKFARKLLESDCIPVMPDENDLNKNVLCVQLRNSILKNGIESVHKKMFPDAYSYTKKVIKRFKEPQKIIIDDDDSYEEGSLEALYSLRGKKPNTKANPAISHSSLIQDQPNRINKKSTKLTEVDKELNPSKKQKVTKTNDKNRNSSEVINLETNIKKEPGYLSKIDSKISLTNCTNTKCDSGYESKYSDKTNVSPASVSDQNKVVLEKGAFYKVESDEEVVKEWDNIDDNEKTTFCEKIKIDLTEVTRDALEELCLPTTVECEIIDDFLTYLTIVDYKEMYDAINSDLYYINTRRLTAEYNGRGNNITSIYRLTIPGYVSILIRLLLGRVFAKLSDLSESAKDELEKLCERGKQERLGGSSPFTKFEEKELVMGVCFIDLKTEMTHEFIRFLTKIVSEKSNRDISESIRNRGFGVDILSEPLYAADDTFC